MPQNMLIQPNPADKRRGALAQAMAGNAMSGQPLGHWTQALGKMMQAYVSGKITDDIASKQDARQAGASQTLEQALAGYRGDTTQTVSGPVEGMPESRPQMSNQNVTIPGNQQNMSELTRVLAGNPDTSHLANNLTLAQITAGMKPQTTSLQEIYDPNSPTGTRFVNKSEAVGQPGKPGSGLKMEFGPDGRPTMISTGRGGGSGGGFGTATDNKIQGKQLDAQEAIARLDNIKALYEPRFQKIGTRMGMKWTSLKSKFDMGEIDATDQKDLYDYSLYKATAFEHMNKLLNELSGAAVSPQEFTRLGNQVPKAGEGIFDGDDPITFQAKMDSSMTNIKRALMRYKYMSDNGREAWSMPLWKIDDVINARGVELEQQFGGQENAQQMIKDQLHKEFLM